MCARKKQSDRPDAGFTLLEVLVALTLFAIGFTCLAAGYSTALHASQVENDRNHARFMAQHQVERISALPFATLLAYRTALQAPEVYLDIPNESPGNIGKSTHGQGCIVLTPQIVDGIDSTFQPLYNPPSLRPSQDFLTVKVTARWGDVVPMGESAYYFDSNLYKYRETLTLSRLVTRSNVSIQGNPSPGNLLGAIVSGLF